MLTAMSCRIGIRRALAAASIAWTAVGPVAAASPEPARPAVFAAYYIWYADGSHPTAAWRHWTHPDVFRLHGRDNPLARPGDPPLASAAYPLVGLYSSRDPAVAEWHMRLARAAGIDAFLVSWWGRHQETDETFATVTLPAAERTGFKVAILDELAQFHRDDDAYARGLAETLARFRDSAAYLHIDGRPVVYLYQVAAKPGLTPAAFALVRREVEARVGPVYWIVDKIAHDHRSARVDRRKCIPADWLALTGIDAFAFYGTFSNFRADRHDELIGEYRHLADQAHAAGRKIVLPVHPGHDNSRFRGDPYRMPRRDGDTLRDYLRAATDAGADAILVTSWNEWPETTVVEPASSWKDPYAYLRILAAWRGIAFEPPADLPGQPAPHAPGSVAEPDTGSGR
jgi:glycoprotein endo-alpha-1,2-mannosidase